MSKLIILDLDNCIANDEWRIKHIDWAQQSPFYRYHNYHSLAAFDEVGNKDLFVDTPHDIAIFTARPIFYSAQTMEWMLRSGIKPNSILIMRPNRNESKSTDLKRMFLGALLEVGEYKKSDIVCAYDDRQEVIDMYREEGVNAELRKIHDTCAYTNPIRTNVVPLFPNSSTY